MIRGVLLDLSGVLYVGNKALPGANKALDKLTESGLPVRYITNTTRKTSRVILDQLSAMDFVIKPDELFTAPIAARTYLERESLRPYLLIHPDLEEEFSDMNFQENVNAVLVGDAGKGFTYEKMNTAFRLIMDGARFLALGVNRYFSEGDSLSLDVGPFVRALEYASGIDAKVLGKPSADFYMSAVESIGCDPSEVIMVGDDVESDVNGALQAGLQAILVRTGKYTNADKERIQAKGHCKANLQKAVDYILQQS